MVIEAYDHGKHLAMVIEAIEALAMVIEEYDHGKRSAMTMEAFIGYGD
jgi:hypothetical protein